MQLKLKQILISSLVFIIICLVVAIAIKPFSIVNFVGPIAGITTAITIVWGVVSIVSLFTGMLLLNAFVVWYFNYQIDAAVVLLLFIAALLQGVWAKQLTYQLVNKQRWLTSRALLISFIIRIGPVTGIVAAIAGVLVGILDNNSFATSTSYTFFVSWTASILSAVFLTPVLLFTHGDQKLTLSKRLLMVVASLLGAIAIGLLFKISQQQHQHQRVDAYNHAKHELEEELSNKINSISAQVNSLTAYFNTSEYIDPEEFNSFAKQIHQPFVGVRALSWAPVVNKEQAEKFQSWAAQVLSLDYKVLFNKDIESQPFTQLNHYFPVLYIYPRLGNETALGLDLYAHPAKYPVIQRIIDSDSALATEPLTLVQDNQSNPAILIFKAIRNNRGINQFGNIASQHKESLVGIVSFVVHFENLIKSTILQLPNDSVDIAIRDITDKEEFIIWGDVLDVKNRLHDTLTIKVFGRHWQLQIVEKQRWLMQKKSWQTWVMMFGGTIGGVAFQILMLMMAAYSIELSVKVDEKTRALKLAHDQSERENQSKSTFLQMLTYELDEPINAIDKLVNNLDGVNNPISDSSVKNSANKLINILHSISDLSNLDFTSVSTNHATFDFSAFIQKVEQEFNDLSIGSPTKVKFLLDDELPNYIESDEVRLEKMLLTLHGNILALFKGSDVQVSVKTHQHKGHSTLFFTCRALNDELDMPINQWLEKDIATFSTSMALVKELVQLLNGKIKLNLLATGNIVITISLSINVDNRVPVYGVDTYNDTNVADKLRVLLIEEPLSTNFETTPLLLGLGYQVEIIDDPSDVMEAIAHNGFDIVIVDNITSLPYVTVIEEVLSKRGKRNRQSVLGIYRGIEYRQLSKRYHELLDECLYYPISENQLADVVNKLTL